VNTKDYQARIDAEHRSFDGCTNLEELLPQIFHYWSTRHISPMLTPFGFDSPYGMFRKYLEKQCQSGDATRCVSIGAGNCSLEVGLARHLRGQADVIIDCLDISSATLERGQAAARQSQVEDRLNFVQADFNTWQPAYEYDVVIANQALHHVLDLEHLFAQVKGCLKPGGRVIISDMIGRNGHQLWPEAFEVIQEFWPRLPPSYRYNHQLQRYEERFVNWDYSQDGFEGFRSQDVLPLLTEYFHFEFFAAYGNLINPFVERSFGPNFDAAAPWDRAFIDEVHARDQREITSGRFKPTQMLAVVGNDPRVPMLCIEPLRPDFCIRLPDASFPDTSNDHPIESTYQWDAWPHDPRAELEIACRRLTEAEVRLHEVRSELDKCAALASHFDAERKERTAWALRLDAELRETTAPVQSLQREIEDRTAWAVQLDKELDERTAWALDLKRELDETRPLNEELTKEVEARTAWAFGLDRELQERTEWALRLKAELDELKSRKPVSFRQRAANWLRNRLNNRQRRRP